MATLGTDDLLCDAFDWRKGYNAACETCDDEHERMLEQLPGFREHFEFLAMRAYWQGLHWDVERFTDSNDNPYLSAEQPRKELIDAIEDSYVHH